MTSPTPHTAQSDPRRSGLLRRPLCALLVTLSLAALLVASLATTFAFDEDNIPYYDPFNPTHPVNTDQQVSSIHFDLVGVLALAAGFSEQDAATVQLYSQLTDSSVLSTTDSIYNFDADPANWPQAPSVKDVPASADCPSPETTSDVVTMGGTDLVECPGCFTSRWGPYGVFFHMPHNNAQELGAIHDWAMGDVSKLTAGVTWGYSSTVPFTWEPLYTVANVANIYEATACFGKTTVDAVDTGSVQPGSLAALGIYLHSLGDYWSHKECIEAADAQNEPFAAHVTVKGPNDPLWACRWTMHEVEFGNETVMDSERTYSGTLAIYDAILAYASNSTRPLFKPIPGDAEGNYLNDALKTFAETVSATGRRDQTQALVQWALWTRFNDPTYADGAITDGAGDAAQVAAYVPSDASQTGAVQVALAANDEHAAAAGTRLVGVPVRVTASAGSRATITQFDKPISLRMGYTQSDLKNNSESDLLIHRWDETSGRWEPILSNRNTDANELIGSTAQTGDFALLTMESGVVAASYFDTDREGWRVDGDVQAGSGIPNHRAVGGNPGGHLDATDDVQGGTWYWVAPDKFLGDISQAYSKTLSFDLRQVSGMADQYDRPDVVIRGRANALIYDTAFNPRQAWTHYSLNLVEGAGWRMIGASDPLTGAVGTAASAAEIQAVLSDVTTLLIRGEYEDGPDEDYLDNVILGGEASQPLVDRQNGLQAQIEVGDLSLLVDFPSGAVSETLRLRSGVSQGHAAPDGLRQIGNGFSLQAFDGQDNQVHQFLQTFTMTLSLRKDANPSHPVLHYWDDNEAGWKQIATSFDPGHNLLTATLDHLTEFAIFDTPGLQIFLPLTTR